ncbi:MAG TPA: VWA domain-containing protein [Candidatus Angelobacter sp.]|jgi:VWFA-related protein|nr:VWA domain-containing protein [Candidatus Angelobacter sp.]
MPWYKRWRTLVPFLALLITSPSYSQSGGASQSGAAADQQSSSPQQEAAVSPSNNVLRSTTRLVVVDVVTVDNKGEPVPDLKADDFTLVEDGKPQKISGFSFQRAHGASAAPSTVHGANVFTNTPQYKDAGCLNVILLDTLNADLGGKVSAKDHLLKYLGSGPAIQPTALFALDTKLTMLSDFTTDSKMLKTVLEDFKPHTVPKVMDVYTTASPFEMKGAPTSERSQETTVNALETLTRALSGYPGRKNLLWLSQAFPINFFPEIVQDDAMTHGMQSQFPSTMVGNPNFKSSETGDFMAAVMKVANQLMNAQVAVYPIDAAGLSKEQRLNSISTMQAMAEQTGGRVFFNNNDLEFGIRSSINDGSTYYTLTYYPSNKTWDGRFRKIAITTTKPGTSLRYRQGYYAIDPGMPQTKKDSDKLARDFSQALGLDSPASTGVIFLAGVERPTESSKPVTVNFAIDPHTLGFERKDDGLQHIMVSCAVAAFSEKGSFVKEEVSNVTAAMKADEFDKMMKGQQFPCKRTINLKPGNYNLTLGVVDRNARLIGTTTAWVKVP